MIASVDQNKIAWRQALSIDRFDYWADSTTPSKAKIPPSASPKSAKRTRPSAPGDTVWNVSTPRNSGSEAVMYGATIEQP
jgi:hypothetical protein